MINPIGKRFWEFDGWYAGMEVVCTDTVVDWYRVGSKYTIVYSGDGELAIHEFGSTNQKLLNGKSGEFELVPPRNLEDFL